MSFRPLAFNYLHDMVSPSGPFEVFNVPTAQVLLKPGFYAPKQGRYWYMSRDAAMSLFRDLRPDKASIDRMPLAYYVIEAWVDRSSTSAPDYVLMGYALINCRDFNDVIVNECLAVHIMTQQPAYS